MSVAPEPASRFFGDTDGDEAWVSIDRTAADSMTQPEIIADMVARARTGGFKPYDFSDPSDETPNVYLRACYLVERDGEPAEDYMGDLFMMPVRRLS